MATTFIDFVPSQVVAPEYQVTLDDNIYKLTVEWVLFAQRYFINLADLSGNPIIYAAMVGSPIGLTIESLSWSRGKVTVTTSVPHYLHIGQVIDLTVSGCLPDAYNGFVQAFVTGRNTLTYDLASDPGGATLVGSVQQNIDLCQGLFTSILVFRDPSQQIEVIN